MASVDKQPPCPACQGEELWGTRVPAGGTWGPYFLPDLGEFLHLAEFRVVVCARCGLTQLFADERALSRLARSEHWHRLA